MRIGENLRQTFTQVDAGFGAIRARSGRDPLALHRDLAGLVRLAAVAAAWAAGAAVQEGEDLDGGHLCGCAWSGPRRRPRPGSPARSGRSGAVRRSWRSCRIWARRNSRTLTCACSPSRSEEGAPVPPRPIGSSTRAARSPRQRQTTPVVCPSVTRRRGLIQMAVQVVGGPGKARTDGRLRRMRGGGRRSLRADVAGPRCVPDRGR